MNKFARLFIIPVATCSLSLPALAQTQPELEIQPELETPLNEPEVEAPITAPETNDVVETGETIDRLFERLRKDTKSKSAGAVARMIWREWAHSGSRSIDLLMSWASRAMQAKEHARALDLLDQIVTLAPDYSEGWNRRATLHYVMSDLSASLADIEKTLALEPRHFGALSGLAAILQRFEKHEEALEAWYKVLEIYPANENAQDAVVKLEERLAGSRI